MFSFKVKMTNARPVLFIMLLYAIPIINFAGSALASDSSTLRMLADQRRTVNKKTIINYDVSKQREYTDKQHQLRHSRFHRIDHTSKKNPNIDDTVPKNSESLDIAPIYNAKVMAHRLSGNENKVDKHTTQKTTYDMNGFTENPRKTTRVTTMRNVVREKTFKEYAADDEEDMYDEYDESDDSFYDDDRDDQVKMIHREAELNDNQFGEMSKPYAVTDKWDDGYTDQDFINDDPSQEDYDQEWEDSPQADASVGPSQNWERVLQEHFKLNNRRMKESEQAARLHIQMIRKQASCKIPKQRVVTIQSVYPNISKQYTPHCTLLHRCGDDIGCCISEIATCAPRTMETINLYFYTKTVGHEKIRIEKLSFINHTECECIERRTDLMIKDDIAFLSQRPAYSLRDSFHDIETEAPITLNKRCRCPTEYSVHMLDNGDCECDCFNKQRDCLRIKRGKEFFGLKDRRCIQNGQCQMPNCEFGQYNNTAGRCPKKHEKLDEPVWRSRLFEK